QSAEREDAGELDLQLNVAVLIEVPEEAVLVVLDGGNRGDDEPAAPPHFGAVRNAAISVLPQNAVILLVHADGVLHGEQVPAAIDHVGVEVLDVAEAIAAEFE